MKEGCRPVSRLASFGGAGQGRHCAVGVIGVFAWSRLLGCRLMNRNPSAVTHCHGFFSEATGGREPGRARLGINWTSNPRRRGGSAAGKSFSGASERADMSGGRDRHLTALTIDVRSTRAAGARFRPQRCPRGLRRRQSGPGHVRPANPGATQPLPIAAPSARSDGRCRDRKIPRVFLTCYWRVLHSAVNGLFCDEVRGTSCFGKKKRVRRPLKA